MESEKKTRRFLLAAGLLLFPAVAVFLTLPHPDPGEINVPTGRDAVAAGDAVDREAPALGAWTPTPATEPEESPDWGDKLQDRATEPVSVVCRLVDGETGEVLRAEPASILLRGEKSVRPVAVRTDSEGIYRLRGLQPGLYALHTRHPAYLPDQRSVEVTEPATSSERGNDPPPIEIHLLSGVELRGDVVTRTGQAVAGARLKLTLLGKEGPQNARERADENGAFTVKGLRKGTWRLAAFRQGHRHAIIDVTVPREDRVRVQLDTDPGFDVLVTDSAGRTVGGARVRQLGRTHGISGRRRSALTGEDGRVHLDGLPADSHAQVKVEVSHPTYLPRREVATREEIESRGLAVVLTRGVQVSGRVADSSEHGIPNAEVRLTPTVPSGRGNSRKTLRTSSTGKFQFRNVKPGTYELEARATEYRVETLVRVEVETEVGTRGLELVLKKGPGDGVVEKPRSPAGSIKGFVVSTEPLGNFAIKIRNENVENEAAGERTIRFSSRSPWFQLRYLTPGSYTLSLVVGGEVLARLEDVEVRSGETTGPVELRQG